MMHQMPEEHGSSPNCLLLLGLGLASWFIIIVAILFAIHYLMRY